MVGWHHRCNGHELEQTLGNRKGQGSLVCCSPHVGHDLETEQQKQQEQWTHHELFEGHGFVLLGKSSVCSHRGVGR